MKASYKTFCAVCFFFLCNSLCAQQTRRTAPSPGVLAKAAIERRLRSIHPTVPADTNAPTPGKYLLDRQSIRAKQLRARIQTANKIGNLVPEGTPSSGLLPGIQFRPSLPAGIMADAVVSGDFNGDGHMDFVVANGGTNDLWIYLGKGDGTFQLPRIIPLTKGLTPVYLAAASLRGNGVLDLIVAEFDTDTIGVLLGNGDGTFGIETEYNLPQAPAALAVADLNHDGKLDIVSVMDTENNPSTLGVPYLATLLGDGTGSFANPIITNNPGFFSTAQSIAVGDVNGDGLPDVLITGPALENSQIYLNAGNGTFSPGVTVNENGPFNALEAGMPAIKSSS
jgi:FG-GAP-like repeat